MKKTYLCLILTLVTLALGGAVHADELPVGTRATWNGKSWTPDYAQSAPKSDIRVIGSYDYYIATSYGPNYGDAQGISLGVEFPIVGALKGRVEGTHIADVDFPEPRDPKGAWGELRGFGGFGSLVYELPLNDRLTFDISAGLGWIAWDFKENPWLQDNDVQVDVDGALASRLGVGASYRLNDRLRVWTSVSWFDTNIGKSIPANAAGIDEILGADGNIGLQYITPRVGFSADW